jgi:Domain of unknown function (DUF4646)
MDATLDHQLDLPPPYGEHATQSSTNDKCLWERVSLPRNKPYADSSSVTPDVIVISSTSTLVISGFPYQNVLASVDVTRQNWSQFTADIARSIRQSSTDRSRIILCGLLTGVVFFFVLGPPSVFAGAASARSMAREVERERLLQNTNLRESLKRAIQEWNEAYFLPRRLHVRLEVPDDLGKEEFPWHGASDRSSRHGPMQSIRCPEANLRITMQQDAFVYWVEGLKRPRLVVTRSGLVD